MQYIVLFLLTPDNIFDTMISSLEGEKEAQSQKALFLT